jgi:hypothetical protein
MTDFNDLHSEAGEDAVKDNIDAAFKPDERRRLQPYGWTQLQSLPKRDYLIKHVLSRRGLSIMFGDPNGGKTFHAIDMALHISKGMKWRGCNTRSGKVLYISAEGGLGITERIRAFELHYGAEPTDNFQLLPYCVDFYSNEIDAQELIKEIKLLGDGFELIVVDTLSQVLADGDENASEGAGKVLRMCRLIEQETASHVLVVHHAGKDGKYRGFSGIKGNVDTMIKVSAVKGMIELSFEKQRDGARDGTFCSKLKVIEVGIDDDGEAITSCVLMAVEGYKPQAEDASKSNKQYYEVLKNLIAEEGALITPNLDVGEVKAVHVKSFRLAVRTYRLNMDKNIKKETINKGTKRFLDLYQLAKKITVIDGYIFLVGQGDK